MEQSPGKRLFKKRPEFENLPELFTDSATSKRLGRIRQHATRAELVVRELLFSLGARYRTKNRDLPGSPDLANRRKRWAVFVHGCYWHSHPGCQRATVPKRNQEFWNAKFAANRKRDAAAIAELRKRGYRAIVVWECEAGTNRTRLRLERLMKTVGRR